MNKGFGLVGVLIAIGIIAVLGGSYYYSQQDESQTLEESDDFEIILNESENILEEQYIIGNDLDEAFVVVKDFANQNYLDKSLIKETNFPWGIGEGGKESNSVSILGWGIDFSKIDTRTYFENKGFSIDWNNSGDATLKGSLGYKKNDVVCKVISTFEKPSVLNCGIFNDDNI
ncbi:MAG: hypothetical protein V1851_01640 [Patescibacteria group bacterium]